VVKWVPFDGSCARWDEVVGGLGGGFHQCHAWGEVRRAAGWQPTRLVAEQEGVTVASASVLIRRMAGTAVCWIPGGIAGPLEHAAKVFRVAVARVAGAPLVYCRMNDLREVKPSDAPSLESAGWRRPTSRLASGLTMAYRLDRDEPERLAAASGNWRHNLRRSARHGLTIERWTDPDPSAVAALYREMEGIKGLPLQHSETELRAILAYLQDQVILFRCLDADKRLLAVRAAGLFADGAWDLLAANGATARKVYASHALLWALFEACRQAGAVVYDLSGVDPVANKGVFDFKQGTGARLVESVGEWDWANFPGLRQAASWMLRRRGGE
jgi:lipid II:glycine glycyltransferase (peptidoglycan interpeptide bridge formation enzyme)